MSPPELEVLQAEDKLSVEESREGGGLGSSEVRILNMEVS